MRSNTLETNWGTPVVNKRWSFTINTFQFCSCLHLSLPWPRHRVCAVRPLCEETFPTYIWGEASRGAGINNSHVRWTQVPLLSFLPHTGLMDTAIILLKGNNNSEHGETAKCTCVILKNRCVFWERSSLRVQGLYSAEPPCSLTRWKRQITSVIEHCKVEISGKSPSPK